MVTVITKTIGPTGRDYSTFTLAESDVTNVGTSGDLVANDEAIVFEADAGDYSENFQFFTGGGLTCDATRNVTWTHATGAEHGGVFEAGANVVGFCIVQEDFAVVDGLSVSPASGAAAQIANGVEGVILRNLMSYSTNNSALKLSKGGTAAAPGIVENCVAKSDSSRTLDIRSEGAGVDSHWRLINCTVFVPTGYFAFNLGLSSSDNLYVELTNNLALGERQYFAFSGPTVTLTGGNNFGGATSPFPAAIQGSPYPITPSTAYDPGAGDFALYVGKNGALLDSPNNDVIDQGVGPSANSDVPTTDILGNARSGATANPGAFEQPQATATITKTIGPSGRDYTTFTLAEADVTNIGGSADLVNENERIVFEADAGTYDGLIFSYTLTTDPTRNVTFKPAAGSEHGGVRGAGVVLQDNTAVTAYNLQVNGPNNLVLEGLESHTRSGVAARLTLVMNSRGVILRNLILNNEGTQITNLLGGAGWGTSTEPIVYENCVIHSSGKRGFDLENGSGSASYAEIINCTKVDTTDPFVFTGGSGAIDLLLLNNLSLSSAAYTNSGTGARSITGSNNFGGATNPFPAAIQGSPYPVTASTAYDPGAGDFALYVSSTGQLLDSPNNDVIGGGVGPTVNANVPTTDIVGRARTGGSANPGAFALAQATRVIGKTIGPTGRDYATFTEAEADVENIATAEFGSTDLVANNGRIEFLADAGTYSEAVHISSTLTTDATRQVTYKPAAGSEHGGDRTAGVIVTSSSFTMNIQDAHTHVRGLVVLSSSAYAFLLREDGVIAADCIAEGTSTGSYAFFATSAGTVSAPLRIENCVGYSADASALYSFTSAGNDAHVVATNVTAMVTGGSLPCFRAVNGATLNVKLTNCLAIQLGAGGVFTDSGSPTITGSNNFGGSTNPFPVALQGSPYPVTATTNTNPGPGHFAIYTAATGALVNVAANTVWQRGVGPSVNSDVPTTDIAGFPRSGATANPGAFAASTALAATTNPVARFLTYKRPSTQVFNHHRRVTCVFPDDGPSGNANTFAVGVAARGFISPVSRDCVAFFVYYTTDGAGGQTSLRLEVARIVGPYSQDAIAEAQPIAVVEKQAVGAAVPSGFNFPGQSHTVAFKVQTFGGATTPESAAEYTAFIDGTAVTFDTFYQSATQDGTTKVVTHPAPAVGTTQGRAEAFFWYATADRTDSLGSENYALPQWSEWNQLAVDADPIFSGDGQSITVEGEGTGTVNLSTAIGEVDWTIDVAYELPRFDVPFASGHRYTSPRFGTARRLITANATNIDKATMDALVRFHAARDGIQDPFLFDFPIPASITSETLETITVQFADTAGLLYERRAENTYSVQLNMIELL